MSVHADSAGRDGRGFHVATSSPGLAPSQGALSTDLAGDLVASLESSAGRERYAAAIADGVLRWLGPG